MVSVVINGKSKEDLDLVIKVAKKMGMSAKTLTKNQIEDMYMGEQIKKGMKSPKVSREQVMKALGK